MSKKLETSSDDWYKFNEKPTRFRENILMPVPAMKKRNGKEKQKNWLISCVPNTVMTKM